MWNPKQGTSELLYEAETDSQTQKTNIVTRVFGGGINQEFEIHKSKLLPITIEQTNYKILLYNTGKYIQCPTISPNRKEYEAKQTKNLERNENENMIF